MILIRKYDLKTFFKKQLKTIYNIYYCIERQIPLRAAFLCDIDISILPAGTIIGHPFGICISSNTQIGQNVDIRQGATIGTKNPRIPVYQGAIIGDNVFIGANSTILGAVIIGDNSIIGAHSLILKDVSENSIIVGLWK